MKTIADKIIAFNEGLDYRDSLPEGFSVLNPFRENPETIQVMERFYHKFYNDRNPRWFIIGINPGRYGAGLTGVPFTDTKRLEQACGIAMKSAHSHEVSAVFVYDMIGQYGGVEKFYNNFYINSAFPLAIVRKTKNAKWVNANYYDDKILAASVKAYMMRSLKKQIAMGLHTDVALVLGKKNADFINTINKTEKLFGKLIVLEHPRFIQQYRSKNKQDYIKKYLKTFEDAICS